MNPTNIDLSAQAPGAVKKRLRTFAIFFLLVYVSASLGFYAFFTWYWAPRKLSDQLPQKFAYYLKERESIDLLFFGDSRTYCAMQPELLDAALGVRSYNMSIFANWFPTQYPLARDLAPQVPAGATVLWSIGHQNFFPCPNIQPQYPIGLALAARYVSWGIAPGELTENLLYFNPLTQLYAQRSTIHKAYLRGADRQVASLGAPTAMASQSGGAPGFGESAELAEAQSLKKNLKKNPNVLEVEILKNAGRVTSLAVLSKLGSYYRIELDKNFFRAKQREEAQAPSARAQGAPPPAAVEPAYWTMFTGMLDMFQERGVNLVVNEMEEAPYTYRGGANREKWRAFMRAHVEPEVARRGFPYIRTGFDHLQDEHYFDYNHLNSKGVEVFTPLLAQALKPYLKEGR